MVSLYTIELIVTYLTLIVAYMSTETLCGFLRAWTAKKLGDDTAERLGFLTLNPLVHLDPIGFFALIFFGLGWGVYVPIDYRRLTEPYSWLKIVIAYLSESMVHLLLVLISLTILIKMFTIEALYLIGPMILSGSISLTAFTTFYPDASSLSLVTAIILVTISYLGLMLGVLNLIVNSFRLGMFFFFDEDPTNPHPMMALIPLLFFMLFAHQIRIYILYFLAHAGHFLASIMGS